MLRTSNQCVNIKGSIQLTDVYPCKEVFPNSHGAKNYHDWCIRECSRIGDSAYIYIETIMLPNEDSIEEEVEVCHIRRWVDG